MRASDCVLNHVYLKYHSVKYKHKHSHITTYYMVSFYYTSRGHREQAQCKSHMLS